MLTKSHALMAAAFLCLLISVLAAPARSQDPRQGRGEGQRGGRIPAVFSEGVERPIVLRLAVEALHSWTAFQQALEARMSETGDLAPISDWTVLRLSALNHIVEHGLSDTTISQETIERTLDLADLLIQHALCAFSLMGADQATNDAKYVARWITRNGARIVAMRGTCWVAMGGHRLRRKICNGASEFHSRPDREDEDGPDSTCGSLRRATARTSSPQKKTAGRVSRRREERDSGVGVLQRRRESSGHAKREEQVLLQVFGEGEASQNSFSRPTPHVRVFTDTERESLPYVKDQLGHSSIKMTVDVYGHLVPGANRQAVNRLPGLTLSTAAAMAAH
jgi:Protein of unknown function (DUF3987)